MLRQLILPVIVLMASTSTGVGQGLVGVGRLGDLVPQSAEAAEDLAAHGRAGARVWVRSEFLVWWIKTASLPALVTTGSISEARPGALDSPNTRVLFGGNNADFQERGGGRFTAGWWLDDEQQLGFEGGYFFLSGRSIGHDVASSGSPVVARPFFNANGDFQDVSLVAFPGIASGRVAIDVPSYLQGAEISVIGTVAKSESSRWEAFGGFRYLNLDDGLHINESSVIALAPQYKGIGIPNDGSVIRVSDRFDTRNYFYGGQFGGRVEMRHKRFAFELLAKAALGVSHEVVTIQGFTGIDTQAATASDAGLLALNTNSGRFTRNVFAVVPETAFKIKFDLTNGIQVFGGYSFLYWSSVARPWDHVDLNINTNLVPVSTSFGNSSGAARPAFTFHSSGFFAHGATFGLEFRF